MTSFWHPVSAVCLGDVAAVATPVVLRLMLAADGGAELRYAGDRMEPALRHGTRFRARRAETPGFVAGEAVVAVTHGVPDVYRVDTVGADGFTLGADADPAEAVHVAASAIVARLDLPARRSGPRLRLLRRLALDLREAARHGPDPAVDAAATVRDKYDAQAVFYSAHRGTDLDPRLLDQIRSQVPAGAAILVAGSGAGRESFALATNGYRVTGIDFSTAMVAQARAEAVRRGLAVDFLEADLRSVDLSPARFAAVLFTYDVYSFLPSRAERADVLARLSHGLAPGGVLFLSARRVRGGWARVVLTVVRLSGRTRPREWGATHTRYVAPDGSLHRSFVRVFSPAQLERELGRAGFELGNWEGGHGACRRRGR